MYKSDDESVKQLVAEFEKTCGPHSNDVFDLMLCISKLEEFNWNTRVARIANSLIEDVDPEDDPKWKEFQYIQDILLRYVENSPAVELSSEEKIKCIQELMRTMFSTSNFKEIDRIVDKLSLIKSENRVKDCISLLERFNWNVRMAKYVVDSRLDFGELLTWDDIEHVEDILIKHFEGTPAPELSKEEKTGHLHSLLTAGHRSFDYERLQLILEKLEF